jgi:hypothetical protein
MTCSKIEMVTAVEMVFGVELDLENLDADSLTKVGRSAGMWNTSRRLNPKYEPEATFGRSSHMSHAAITNCYEGDHKQRRAHLGYCSKRAGIS